MGWLDRFQRPRAVPVDDRLAQALAAAGRGDHRAALEIWGPLAQAGVARAQNNIGACFAEGLGVEPDAKLARHWLTLAAEGGDRVGQRNLAALLLRGDPPDYIRAAALYGQAAAQGDAPAQDMLSWLLVEGKVPAADLAQARHWAHAAAEQGIVAAMTRLAMLYHNALGGERDPAEAARWWRCAAVLGDADAQAMLGAAHTLGSGVAHDPVEALAWLLRARAGGSALAAPFLGPAKASLTPGEIAAAERRAAAPPLEAVP